MSTLAVRIADALATREVRLCERLYDYVADTSHEVMQATHGLPREGTLRLLGAVLDTPSTDLDSDWL